MTPKEYLALLNEAEAKFPVETWQSHGFHIWPVLKVGCAFALDSYAKLSVQDTLRHHAWYALKDLFCYALASCKDFSHHAKIQKTDIVFLSLTLQRYFPYEGKWFNAFYDSLLPHLQSKNISSLLLESSSRGEYRTPRFSHSRWIQPTLNRIAIQSVFSDAPPSPTDWNGFHEFERFLSLPELPSILKRIPLIRRWADFFKSTLRQTEARYGCVVSYYGPLGMAFNLACRESHIRSIDLQHCVQGEGHVAYQPWSRCPNAGYEVLPADFWCWTENDQNFLQSWLKKTLPNSRAVWGGNPVNDSIAVKKLKSPGKSGHRILITLQATGLNPVLLETIRIAPRDWEWWIRPHPLLGEDLSKLQKRLNQIQGLKWEYQKAASLPLPVILLETDAHLTELSSSVASAAEWGIPSVVTHPNGKSYFSEERKKGFVQDAYNPQAILNALKEFLTKNKGEIKPTPPRTHVALAQLLDASF